MRHARSLEVSLGVRWANHSIPSKRPNLLLREAEPCRGHVPFAVGYR